MSENDLHVVCFVLANLLPVLLVAWCRTTHAENGHGCPKRKQGMCLLCHEDMQEYSADELEEIPCLRGAVQQLRKLLNDLE